jgi:hypothetical protein
MRCRRGGPTSDADMHGAHRGVEGEGPGRGAKRRMPASRGPVANGPGLLNQ